MIESRESDLEFQTRRIRDTSCPGRLALLETFLAEDRSSLRWAERNGRVLPAGGALSLGFDPIARARSRRGPGGPLRLAALASLGLVLELLVREKELLTRRPDELRSAIHTLQDLVLELHGPYLVRSSGSDPVALLGFATGLLAVALARQGLLRSTLVTRLQVERVLLDVLDDVFLLHLPLEATESALDRLALLNLHFSHENHTPFGWRKPMLCALPSSLTRSQI